MNIFSKRFIKVWQRNGDVFRTVWKPELPGIIVEPVIIILAMGAGLGGYVGLVDGQSYIEFIVPGIISNYAMYSATFECTYGSFIRMEYQKTYDAIISTPLNIQDVIAGEIFWGATRSFITGIAVLIVSSAFQLVHSPWAVLVPVVVFLEGLLFASLSMFFTSLVPTIYSFNYYFTLFITPMFFFSGVFFPLDSFPKIVQDLSWIAPLTPVVRLNRALINGDVSSFMFLMLGMILVEIVIFFTISMLSMKRRLTV